MLVWSAARAVPRAGRAANPLRVLRASVSHLAPTRTQGLYRRLVEGTLRNTRVEDPLAMYNRLQRTDIDEPDELRVIDIRETFEFNEESVDGALYLPRGILERDIEAFVPNVSDPVVLLCSNGERSALAAESLTRLGYNNVSIVQGGLANWKNNGLPTNKQRNTYAALSEQAALTNSSL